MIRALALCALVALPALGAAAKKPPPLAELKKDFNAGEFERVIRRADAALKAGGEPQDIGQLQLWRGQALLALGREADARAAFVAAVEAWPDIELDAQRSGPDAVRVFTRARESVPGTLSVQVTGGEGTVRVDEKDLGPAPLVTQVGAGRHVVEARAAPDLSARAELEVKPGKKHELVLELKAPEPKPTPPPEPVAEKPPPPEPKPEVVVVPAPPPPPPPPASPSRIGVVPLLGGVVVGAVGGVLLWQANTYYASLNDNPDGPVLTSEQSTAALRNGPIFESLGWVAVGVGGAAAIAGVLMLALAPSSPAQAGLFATPGGGGITVSAQLP